jgi:hypothetical protein
MKSAADSPSLVASSSRSPRSTLKLKYKVLLARFECLQGFQLDCQFCDALRQACACIKCASFAILYLLPCTAISVSVALALPYLCNFCRSAGHPLHAAVTCTCAGRKAYLQGTDLLHEVAAFCTPTHHLCAIVCNAFPRLQNNFHVGASQASSVLQWLDRSCSDCAQIQPLIHVLIHLSHHSSATPQRSSRLSSWLMRTA